MPGVVPVRREAVPHAERIRSRPRSVHRVHDLRDVDRPTPPPRMPWIYSTSSHSSPRSCWAPYISGRRVLLDEGCSRPPGVTGVTAVSVRNPVCGNAEPRGLVRLGQVDPAVQALYVRVVAGISRRRLPTGWEAEDPVVAGSSGAAVHAEHGDTCRRCIQMYGAQIVLCRRFGPAKPIPPGVDRRQQRQARVGCAGRRDLGWLRPGGIAVAGGQAPVWRQERASLGTRPTTDKKHPLWTLAAVYNGLSGRLLSLFSSRPNESR